MARYRNDMDDERDYYPREERFRREALGSYDEPYSRREQEMERRNDYGRGRFGERANYNQDEPPTVKIAMRGQTAEIGIGTTAGGARSTTFAAIFRPDVTANTTPQNARACAAATS